jgi:hypothetical protein
MDYTTSTKSMSSLIEENERLKKQVRLLEKENTERQILEREKAAAKKLKQSQTLNKEKEKKREMLKRLNEKLEREKETERQQLLEKKANYEIITKEILREMVENGDQIHNYTIKDEILQVVCNRTNYNGFHPCTYCTIVTINLEDGTMTSTM